MRRSPIEAVKQEVRALTAEKQFSASLHAECGYARGAWCCYRIWPNACNACMYILQPVSLLCGPLPFALLSDSWIGKSLIACCSNLQEI